MNNNRMTSIFVYVLEFMTEYVYLTSNEFFEKYTLRQKLSTTQAFLEKNSEAFLL